MTPHINAKKKDIASFVIMPGDPLRAKWIAEKFLKKPKLINEVRGMLGYTGTYKNKKVTVMGHGMGIPSAGIYTFELFKFYGVKKIIRVGSAGSYDSKIAVGDVIVASEAYSASPYAKNIGVECKNKVLLPSKKLLDQAIKNAKKLNIKLVSCRVNSEDAFYNKYSVSQIKKATGALAAEMEAFAIYANANLLKKEALTLLTCSDSLVTKESMSPVQRQTTLEEMIKLALSLLDI